MKLTLGQQFAIAVQDIRQSIQDDYLSLDYVKGLFGPAMAAIAYLQQKGELDPIFDNEIGKPITPREGNL